MVDIKTMELAYLFKLSLNNKMIEKDKKTIEKEFNDKNKRDSYIKKINDYIKEKETEKDNEVDILKKQLEEQIISIENSYVNNLKTYVDNCYNEYVFKK